MKKKEWKKLYKETKLELDMIENELKALCKVEKKLVAAVRFLKKHSLLDEFNSFRKQFEEEQKEKELSAPNLIHKLIPKDVGKRIKWKQVDTSKIPDYVKDESDE